MSRVSPAAETLLITDFCRIPDNPFQSYGEAAMFFGCCLGYEGIPDEEWIKPAENDPETSPGVRPVCGSWARPLHSASACVKPGLTNTGPRQGARDQQMGHEARRG